MSIAMNPLSGDDSTEELKLSGDCEDTTTDTQTNAPSCEISTATQETSITTTSHKPQPRLCHLKKWPHFQGYGFNLHAERAKTGQHIGKVDVDSPAESAGLREGDRIIEVNNVNISNENHQQVVKRIRNGLEKNGKFYDNEVLLLVLDHETDMYYRNLNVIVKADFKNVLKITTVMPDNEDSDEEDVNNNDSECVNQNQKSNTLTDATNTILAANSLSSISQKSISSNNNTKMSESQNNVTAAATTTTTSQNENSMNGSVTSMTNKSSNKDAVSSASNLSLSSNNQSNSSKATTPNIQAKNETNNSKMLSNSIVDNITESIYEQNSIDRRDNNNNSKNAKKMSNIDPFQMSAAEFKTYLKSKGRVDPRIAQVDMRQKFQMFQDM